jgi:hypothetical protein
MGMSRRQGLCPFITPQFTDKEPRFSMLSTEVDWELLKKEFEYVESDSVAVIRNDSNSIHWEPVFLNAATNEAFIKDNGKLIPVREVYGFKRFEKVKIPTKSFFEPLSGRTWEVPKYA